MLICFAAHGQASIHNAFGTAMGSKNGMYDNARSAAQSGLVTRVASVLGVPSTFTGILTWMQDNVIPILSASESQEMRLMVEANSRLTISVTNNDLRLMLAEIWRLRQSSLPFYVEGNLSDVNVSGEIEYDNMAFPFKINKVDELQAQLNVDSDFLALRTYQAAPCSKAEFCSDPIIFDSDSCSISEAQKQKLFSKRSYIDQLMAQNDRCVLIYIYSYTDLDRVDLETTRMDVVKRYLGRLDKNPFIQLRDTSADGNCRVQFDFLTASPSSVQDNEFLGCSLDVDMAEQWLDGQLDSSSRTQDMDSYFTALLRKAASVKKYIQGHPNDLIIIEGYSGTEGTPLENLNRGIDRAQCIRELLINVGVTRNNLIPFSYGEWGLPANTTASNKYVRFTIMPEASMGDQYKQPPYSADIYFKQNSIEPTEEGWRALLRIAVSGALGLNLASEFIDVAPEGRAFNNQISISGYVSADEEEMLDTGNRYNSLDYNRSQCVDAVVNRAYNYHILGYISCIYSGKGIDGGNDGAPGLQRRCAIDGVYTQRADAF
jgi:hypothetical protein